MRRTRWLAGLISIALCASGCKDKGDNAAPPVSTRPTPAAAAAKPPPPPVIREGNQPPSFELPAWQRVGVDQEIGFGLEVVDEESDEIIVELIEKPESASYDPVTLTVVWKPSRDDMPRGRFRVGVTEKRGEDRPTRVYTHEFSIAVDAEPQPPPVARELGPVIETLLTIRDPARLAAVNKKWPIDAMLERAARSAHAALPEGEQAGVAVASRQELYRAFLAELARVHQNPSVDPGSESFDAATWADPRRWKIIAVRPRLDKKWHELRIVYKADAHAASYAMFRFRPFAEDRPEALDANNEAMARMVVAAFFTEDGQLDPALARDREAHGKKVAELVRRVLEHESSAHPWHRSTFLALPCEARLGGGSKRDGEGGYVSGDGWAWNVMKGVVADGKMVVGGVPILGFVSGLAATEDGKSWAMKCGPRFDKSAEGHDPRLIGLCRETGNTDLPGAGDGYREAGPEDEVVSAFVDAANLFLDHKEAAAEAVPLRDPRRELFEEKGMTCSQCHVRRFGVRDLYDPSATDPAAGAPTLLNKRQPPTYFVIVPTERWQPYAIDFQHEQECEVKAAIEERLGITTSLGCPLRER